MYILLARNYTNYYAIFVSPKVFTFNTSILIKIFFGCYINPFPGHDLLFRSEVVLGHPELVDDDLVVFLCGGLKDGGVMKVVLNQQEYISRSANIATMAPEKYFKCKQYLWHPTPFF